MSEVWQPTDWARVDAIIEYELLQSIRNGDLRVKPDPDNPGCIVWDYDTDDEGYAVPDYVENGGPFVDEVMDLHKASLIGFRNGNVPYLLPQGEQALAELDENPPPPYESSQKMDALPEFAREEAVRAIQVLDTFGYLDAAREDTTHLAESLKKIIFERWQTAFDDGFLEAALPALIHEALLPPEDQA